MKRKSLELLNSSDKKFNILLNSTILDKIIMRSIEEVDFLELDAKSNEKNTNINKLDFDILHKIYWNNSIPTSLSISKNGKYLTIGFFNGTIGFWSMIDGLYLGKIQISKKPITSISSSENEEFIAIGIWDGYICVYSILQGKIIYHKKVENRPIRKIQFLNNLDLISYLTDDSKIYFLSLKTDKKLLLNESEFKITAYDIKLYENLLFLGFDNGLIEIFNFNRNFVVNKIFRNKFKILNLSVSQDCKYLLTTDESYSTSLSIYNLDSLKPVYYSETFGTCLDAKFVNFSDVIIAIINSSSNIKILSKKESFTSKSVITKGKDFDNLLKKIVFDLNDGITTASITDDTKKACFGTKTGFISIYSLDNKSLINSELLEINVPVNNIFTCNKSSKYIFVNKNGNVYIYNYKNSNFNDFYVLSLETKDFNFFMSENVLYWTDKEKKFCTIDILKENKMIEIFHIDFNPHSILLFKDFFYISTFDGQIFIYDFKLKKIVDCFNTEIENGMFSVNKKFNIICYYNNKNLKLYDRWGKLLNEMKFDLSKIGLLTFSKDGLHFAISCDDEVLLYDLVLLEKLKTFAGHFDKVVDIKFKSNPNILLSIGLDKIVNFWKFDL
jgi:predicted RNA-binding protein